MHYEELLSLDVSGFSVLLWLDDYTSWICGDCYYAHVDGLGFVFASQLALKDLPYSLKALDCGRLSCSLIIVTKHLPVWFQGIFGCLWASTFVASTDLPETSSHSYFYVLMYVFSFLVYFVCWINTIDMFKIINIFPHSDPSVGSLVKCIFISKWKGRWGSRCHGDQVHSNCSYMFERSHLMDSCDTHVSSRKVKVGEKKHWKSISKSLFVY